MKVRTIGWLSIALFALPAQSQWSADPLQNTVVTDEPNLQSWPHTAVTPDGMTWVAWLNRRANGHEVRLQLLDQAGVRLLPEEGLLVRDFVGLGVTGPDLDVIAASDGSCVLVCVDGFEGNEVNVYAHRVDGAGDQLWGAAGIQLATADELMAEREPCVVVTGAGHFAIAWARFGLTTTSPGELRMQLLDGNGNRLLGPEGIIEPGTPFEKPGRCELAATPDGGWILAWVRSTQNINSVANLHAQRYASDGTPLWPAPVVVSSAAPLYFGDHPRILSDGVGGAVLAWQSNVSGVTDVRVQHLDAQGLDLYPHDGAPASIAVDRQEYAPVLLYDSQSAEPTVYFGTSNQTSTAWGLSGQRFSPAGARLWSDAGKVVQPLDGEREAEIAGVSFGDGALLFLLEKYGLGTNNGRLNALRVDALGDPVWSPSARLLSGNFTAKAELSVGMDSAGMGIAAWTEDVVVYESDIRAQNVHPDGSLGLVSGCSAAVYCLGAPNSVGNGAGLGTSGSASVALGSFTLEAGDAPPGNFGLFILGNQQAQTPFGDGQLCIGGTILRLLPPSVISPAGTAVHTLDFDTFPANQIAPGSTWNFQFWYRDPTAGGTGFNLSDGLSSTFCP